MPTARPSISASVGAVLETVITLDDHDHRGDGDPDADERGEDRHAGRDQRPEGDHQDQERHEQAQQLGHLARVGACLVGVATDVAVTGDLGGAVPRRQYLVEGVLGGDLVGEADLRQGRGGPGVQRRGGRGQRVVDRHAVDRVDGLHERRDLGGVRLVGDLAAPGREQHLARRTGEPEALGEQVLPLLRVRARDEKESSYLSPSIAAPPPRPTRTRTHSPTTSPRCRATTCRGGTRRSTRRSLPRCPADEATGCL